ncbi:MAG: hypothetical protein KJO81_05295 [Gammaproteobacteria bacterium]|nr:hypothetical protein [Gammaproteobacteria bacterium]NNE64815.1 hypothetical protein [Gammaproteobacteria bacterium]
MSYKEDIKKLLRNFTDEEKEILISKYGIDPSDPQLTIKKNQAFIEMSKRIHRIEKKALKKLNPEKFIEPKGLECSLCSRAENEVNIMAKHTSGFNLCDICTDSCLHEIRSTE